MSDMRTPRYSVTTCDHEIGEWTPQQGLTVPSKDVKLFALRPALRQLKGMGYGWGRESMLSVLVELVEEVE